MRPRIAIFVAALSLAIAAVAAAQAKDAGTIIRLDHQASVVMLEGGRMYRVTPNTVILVDNRPVAFKALQPGAHVSIQDGEPMLYRDRKYIALKPVPGPAVAQAESSTQAPAPVVTETTPRLAVTTSKDTPVTAEPLTVRRTIYGVVTDVDSNGNVKIKTDGESFEAQVGRDALREINKGDNVVIDLSISPPGAASPR